MIDSMVWESEFKIEEKHRPCICGICHKQIGVKTSRLTLVVTNDEGWNCRDYKKFYHLNCMIEQLIQSCKEVANNVIDRKMRRLTKLNKLVEEIK